MDEGRPISYLEVSHHVPVYASDASEVGSVHHVVSAPAEDIFHGIVIKVPDGLRFIAADDIAALHEGGVDLRIDSAAVANAPFPHGAAPAWHDREPGVKPSTWKHVLGVFTGADPHAGSWTKED